jgi:Sulfocyanin (SoxE).
MRIIKLKTSYILVALAIAALLLVLALLASNPQAAHAVTTSPTPTVSPSPTASPSPAPTASPAPLQVNASQAEFSVASDPTGVPTGSVQFNVTNHGAIAHEFVIMQTDNPPNALLYDDTTQKALEDAPGQQDVGEVGGEDPFLLPGHTESGNFDLAPGRYVLLCNIPGHYKAGMYTSFTVGSVSPATNVPTPSPTAAPTPTAASLPRSGGAPGDSTTAWIWLAAGLVVLGAATVWLRLTSKRSH